MFFKVSLITMMPILSQHIDLMDYSKMKDDSLSLSLSFFFEQYNENVVRIS